LVGWSVATCVAVTTSLGPHDVTFLRFGLSALLLWAEPHGSLVMVWRDNNLTGGKPDKTGCAKSRGQSRVL
jgi:hypothetical protein